MGAFVKHRGLNIAEIKKLIDPKIVEKSLAGAIKVAARKVSTAIDKQIRQNYAVKTAMIKDTLTTKIQARDGAFDALMTYRGQGINLIHFAPRSKPVTTSTGKKRRGTTIKIKKTGGRKLVPHGFLGEAKNVGLLVFRRMGQKRKPMRSMYTIAVPQMVETTDVLKAADEIAGDALYKEWVRQMNYLIEKNRGRA